MTNLQLDPKYQELLNRPLGSVTIFEIAQLLGQQPPSVFQMQEWHNGDEEYQDALNQAQKLNRVMFALFTAPAWCSPCANLEKEVIGTNVFQNWANQKVILLKLDFSNPPDEGLKQLATKHQVSGYPTALGLNPDGSERGRLAGYSLGTGPQIWLSQFETNTKMNISP